MTHRKKIWLYAVLSMVVAALVGLGVGLNVPSSGGVAKPALVLPLLYSAVALLGWLSWSWWQSTDDVQKQGQLTSWWWGGNAGALLAFFTFIVLTGRHSELSLGATYMVLTQFAGFALVWVCWRIRGWAPSE